MKDSYAAYLEAVRKAKEAEEAEEQKFETEVTLTISELQELLGLQLSCDLRTKLENALRHAQHNYSLKNVDFGDLGED